MKTLVVLFFILFAIQAKAAIYQVIKDGPVHEAYVTQEFDTVFLEAITERPPDPITELEPMQNDPETIWIPGYWSWSQSHHAFLWVSGIWRRPPPGRHWVSGYWKKRGDDWVWFRGYWEDKEASRFAYIPQAPPDPIEENIGSPPTTVFDYFWVPGYWSYDFEKKHYEWLSGRWTFFHPHWMYVPPHYVWREEGYLFVSSFWDWPLDVRGLLFLPIYVTPALVDVVVYRPQEAIGALEVLRSLFPYWPSFQILFCYEYHFHHDAWTAWGVTPVWWDWPEWWTFTSTDAWRLWWWWSHPGYPNPGWVDTKLASTISPPSQDTIHFMQKISPPAFVTPNGVVGTHLLLSALEKFSGHQFPILPEDPKQRARIQGLALPYPPPSPYLVPQGSQEAERVLKRPSLPIPNIAPSRPLTLPPEPLLTFDFQDTELFLLAQLESVSGMLPSEAAPGNVPDYGPALPLVPPGPAPPPASPPAAKRQPRLLRRDTPPANLPNFALPTPRATLSPSAPTKSAERPIPKPQGPQLNLPLFGHPGQFFSNPHPRTVGRTALPIPPLPQTQMRMMESQTYIPRLNLPPPQQGYLPPYTRYERPQMQTEHHDYLMSHPQPQVNPPGPNVYETPGDYSTLPGI